MNIRLKITCFIATSFISYFPVTAQIPGMRKYTQLDGYTATKGYEIEQDERGNILLGTDNGGMIFDGKKFRIALNIQQAPDAEILYMRPLGDSRILLLPLTGDASYLDKGKLVTAADDRRLVRPKTDHNTCLKDPVTGAWWLYSDHSDRLYRFYKKEIQAYEIKGSGIRYFRHVIDNCVYGYNEKDQFFCYNLKTKVIQRLYDEQGAALSEKKNSILRGGFGPGGYMLGYSNNAGNMQPKVYQVKTGDSILKVVRKLNIPLLKEGPSLTLDRNNHLWIKLFSSKPGILYCPPDTETGTQQGYYHIETPAIVNSTFIDRNNNLWLSAPNNTLYFLSANHFRNFLLTGRFPFRDKIPQAISGDKYGKLYLGYLNDNRIACVNGQNSQTLLLEQHFSQGVKHIITVSDKYLLFLGGAAALFDTKHCTIKKTFPFKVVELIKDACLVGENGLLIASVSGVYFIRDIFDYKEQEVIGKGRIFEKRTTTVGTLKNKQVLIGTPGGLWIKQDVFASATRIDHPVLHESNIVDIKQVYDGGALVATIAQGLFIIKEEGRKIKKIKIPADLKQIRRIYIQDDSTSWLATDNGAYRLLFDRNWSVRSIKHYDFYDGLPSNSVTDIYVSRDTAYFTTMQGVGVVLLKDSSWQHMSPPSIFINSIQADTAVIYEPDSAVILSRDQNNMVISLSAISYESLGNINYFYKLSALHDKWVQTNNPDIRFTGLPPGHYIFTAYATNAKGTKSIRPAVLYIYIRPAIWQTIYFKVALFVFLSASMLLLFRNWILRREKKKYIALQQKKHLAELELEAIKAQINPHFIYNCLNSIKYLNYTGEYDQSQQYLNLFARLIRMTMQYSRQTFISLTEEIDYLSNYLQLEKLRFKDMLQYSIDIEGGIDRNVQLPALLLQPYVENALKHGMAGKKKEGKIQIIFQRKNNGLDILIKDNGPGFPDLQSPGTLGLHLAGARARSYNELFDMNIQVNYQNEKDRGPGKTGAIVNITIYNII